MLIWKKAEFTFSKAHFNILQFDGKTILYTVKTFNMIALLFFFFFFLFTETLSWSDLSDVISTNNNTFGRWTKEVSVTEDCKVF